MEKGKILTPFPPPALHLPPQRKAEGKSGERFRRQSWKIPQEEPTSLRNHCRGFVRQTASAVISAEFQMARRFKRFPILQGAEFGQLFRICGLKRRHPNWNSFPPSRKRPSATKLRIPGPPSTMTTAFRSSGTVSLTARVSCRESSIVTMIWCFSEYSIRMPRPSRWRSSGRMSGQR